MADDYRVQPRSDVEIRRLAKKLREFFGVSKDRRVDVLACLNRDTIWTVKGMRRLNSLVLPDSEMGGTDGKTSHNGHNVLITIKKSVRDDALLGLGRARNTIAHEFGHAVMHDGAEMLRLACGNTSPKWIKPFESAEHQVKIFAPAFLINDIIAKNLTSIAEISIEFGISLESAEIYFSQLMTEREREIVSVRVRRAAEEFRESLHSQVNKLHFLELPCPACGHYKVFPVDAKFMCQQCDNVFDRFQDGDPG